MLTNRKSSSVTRLLLVVVVCPRASGKPYQIELLRGWIGMITLSNLSMYEVTHEELVFGECCNLKLIA